MYFFTPVVIKNTVQSKMYGARLSAHPCTRLMGQTVSSEEAPSRMNICDYVCEACPYTKNQAFQR